jgi:hypothetical protein
MNSTRSGRPTAPRPAVKRAESKNCPMATPKQKFSTRDLDPVWQFQSEPGLWGVVDHALGADCMAHVRMFLNSSDLVLDRAVPGTFSLTLPTKYLTMFTATSPYGRHDYRQCAGVGGGHGVHCRCRTGTEQVTDKRLRNRGTRPRSSDTVLGI